MYSKPDSTIPNQPDIVFSQPYFNRFNSALDSELTIANDKNKGHFEPSVWLAYAQFSHSEHRCVSKATLVQQQKQAVRQLLSLLIKHYTDDFEAAIDINTDSSADFIADDADFILRVNDTSKLWLDQSRYPYRLHPVGYYVSFSHSNNTVACVISKTPVGIDLELSKVSFEVAKRFYHVDEINWLQTLPELNRQHALKLLWMLKESTIKRVKLAQHKANLIRGLKDNLLTPAKCLLKQSRQHELPYISYPHCYNNNANKDIDCPINYLYLPSLMLVIAV